MILLDTNVLIHYLKGDPAIVTRIGQSSPDELAIPAIVFYELEYGTLKSKMSSRRKHELEEGLRLIQHVPFDSDAAAAAARIRLDLEKRGSTIGALDLLIAGTAVSRGATLVSNNTAEFSRIAGLHVVDWRSA